MTAVDDPKVVVTLIAECRGGLPPSRLAPFLDEARSRLGEHDGVTDLGEAEAVDIFYHQTDLLRAHETWTSIVQDGPIDAIVQYSRCRRKKLLVTDMESTIIEQEMLDELAEYFGLRAQVSNITQRAMNGELDFIKALNERVGLLKGIPQEILDSFVPKISLMPGAQELVATMKKNGAICYLVSGGFTCFAEPVANRLSFDRVWANTLSMVNGLVAGTVEGPLVDKHEKARIFRRVAEEHKISLEYAVALGDGANDVPMLEACNEGRGLGIAFRAKPSVRTQIRHCLNKADLTGVLFAQGIERKSFIGHV